MSNVIKRSSKLTYFTIPVFALILIGLYVLPSKLDFSYQIKFGTCVLNEFFHGVFPLQIRWR